MRSMLVRIRPEKGSDDKTKFYPIFSFRCVMQANSRHGDVGLERSKYDVHDHLVRVSLVDQQQ